MSYVASFTVVSEGDDIFTGFISMRCPLISLANVSTVAASLEIDFEIESSSF